MKDLDTLIHQLDRDVDDHGEEIQVAEVGSPAYLGTGTRKWTYSGHPIIALRLLWRRYELGMYAEGILWLVVIIFLLVSMTQHLSVSISVK